MASELTLPNHLAMIIDGNRRWSKARGLPVWCGHREGAKRVGEFLEWCLELGISNISIYTLSVENLARRPKKELHELFKIIYEYVDRLMNEKYSLLEKYSVRVRFVGDLERLPKKLIRIMGKVMKKTAKHNKKLLNFLVAYSGKHEIVNAVKKITEKLIKTGKIEITEKEVEKNLWVPMPVDLIIRTGGYNRLSNFLLWQASYAEIITLRKLWPDFTKRDLIRCIKKFSSIRRNLGK